SLQHPARLRTPNLETPNSLLALFQRLDNAAQRLDHLGALDAAFAKPEDQIEFFGGGGEAKDRVPRPLVGLALLAGLLPVDKPQREAPDELSHFVFLFLAGDLKELGLREYALLDAQRLDPVGNRPQAEQFGDRGARFPDL